MPDHSWKTFFFRMLSLGFNREQALMANRSNPSSNFQQEALLRSVLKEIKRNRNVSDDIPLSEVPFIVLDSETTGFRPEHGDEVISLAAAKVSRHRIDPDYFSTHVKPTVKIPDSITELTGVSRQDVQQAPMLKEVIRDLITFMGEGVIVGYHIAHDIAFLKHFMWKNYRRTFTQPVIDIQQVMKAIGLKGSFSTLDDALAYFKIESKDRHKALGDVKLTAQLWQDILEHCHGRNILTLHDLYVKLSHV